MEVGEDETNEDKLSATVSCAHKFIYPNIINQRGPLSFTHTIC